ncbi:MAG: lipoyl(octanoyl) transferase LipB [Candidatus Hydromicrobium sp.]
MAYNLQTKLFELIKLKDKPGVILLLEHYPVITIGSNRNTGNLLVSREELRQQDIELVQSTRGGDITLHTPGQIVCYTIFNLALIKKDLTLFVYNLEQVIIDMLASYNIQGTRIDKHRGIFVNNSKIASIGLKIKKWTTFHGFSINVNNNLKYFDNITACGLKYYPQTSIKKISKETIPIYDVKEQLRDSFGNIFKIPVLRII